jgi:hypothetical protein
MVEWRQVKQDLPEAEYVSFELKSGKTVIPELRGEWVVGKITYEEQLNHENQTFWQRIVGSIPGSGAIACAGPDDVPKDIHTIADRYDLNVVIVGVSSGYIRVALCDPSEQNSSS